MASVQNHIIHTADLVSNHRSHRRNSVDPSRQRYQFSIGDDTGLTRTGVHLCRVAPNNISTTLHWHTHEDEWFYIIHAADNATLIYRDVDASGGDDAPKQEVKVSQGDFIDIPAGRKLARAFSSGDGELVYLLGGSREQLDVIYYPETRERGVVSRDESKENGFWMAREDGIKTLQ